MNAPEQSRIYAISALKDGGRLPFPYGAHTYLGRKEKYFELRLDGEWLLMRGSSASGEGSALRGRTLHLPDQLVQDLALQSGDTVCFVGRDDALALKAIAFSEKQGDQGEAADLETATRVTRTLYTNPPVEQMLARYREQLSSLALAHAVHPFLEKRTSVEAWLARQILGKPSPDDEALRESLTTACLDKQRSDGSWQNKLAPTTRGLRELIDLGLPTDHDAVRRGTTWLLETPERSSLPGLFLMRDRYALPGTTKKRSAGDVKQLQIGDPLLCDACGLGVIGATCLAMDVLSDIPICHDHPRYQRAVETLARRPWCESDMCNPDLVFDTEDIQDIEAEASNEYTYCGWRSLEDHIRSFDPNVIRTLRGVEEDTAEYCVPLRRRGGCAIVTTRALSRVNHPWIARRCIAGLYSYVGSQFDGGFVETNYQPFYGPQDGYVDLFARYNAPIAELGILRLLPWVVANQNADGSWGEEGHRDASTFAVLRGLERVGLVSRTTYAEPAA